MAFYILAWATNIFFGFGSVASKLSSKHQIVNPWFLNFILGIFIVLFILPLAFMYGVHLPSHWSSIWLSGLFSMIAGTLYILAMYKLDISVLSPLYSFRSLFSLLIGVSVFKEQLTSSQILYIGLIIVAGLFVSLDEHFSFRSFFSSSIGLALIAVLSSSMYGATLKYAMQFDGYWEVTIWNNIIGVAISCCTLPLFWKEFTKTRVKQYQGIVWSALFYALGLLTVTKAYSVNISVTSAILSVPMSMLMAVILSLLLPKLLEKHTIKIYVIRFSAAVVMVFAAIQLSV